MSFVPKTNRLAHETSPYLQQHAHNPVDWYPWGTEALAVARRENKPILLSIGYAACHWCHVMAHESFEDEATAAVMNEFFINIKVDREERPDLDKIYQTAHYILSQSSGGWPLTIFLSPEDQVPFFSGTYFPPVARYHLPAFTEILHKIADAYKKQPDLIKQQNQEVQRILQHEITTTADASLNLLPLEFALQALQNNYDKTAGGFGGAPKFPQASRLDFLLNQHSNMAFDTLNHMALGGIYDQLEGGFYRYSVDANWQIPHFEKMLYDNGQLLFSYATAASIEDSALYLSILQSTANWVMHKMQSPEGGYYSSLDADSEGHEGKYYVWDKLQLEQILSVEEHAVIQHYFGLDATPNFEKKSWHFCIKQSPENVALLLKMNLETVNSLLISAKEKLLLVRSKRISPALDNKILTSWNGLMIKGMVAAGEVLQQLSLIESAQKALTFLYEKMWINHRLLASYKDNHAHLPAYLDDYAYLIDALLTMLKVSWDTKYLLFAQQLADVLLEKFYDKNLGGFFFTAHDHETLLYRPKTMADEAIPSGNGVAVRVLIILGYLLGESRYLDAAEKTLKFSWPSIEKFPAEHSTLLLGLRDFLKPHKVIIIRGVEKEMAVWKSAIDPVNNLIFAIPSEEEGLPEALAVKKASGKISAYICQGTHCSVVIDDMAELLKYLQLDAKSNI
jgi:uncharacterized protein YyaL (SSP411 family)